MKWINYLIFDHFICRLLPESLNDDECMDGYFTTSFCGNLQHKLWNLLENPNSSFAAKVRHFWHQNFDPHRLFQNMTVVSHYENHLVFVNVSCSGPYWTKIGPLTSYVQYIQDSTKS